MKNPYSSLILAVIRQDLELMWGGGKQRIGGLGTQWAPRPTANGARENLEVRDKKAQGRRGGRREKRTFLIFFLQPSPVPASLGLVQLHSLSKLWG